VRLTVAAILACLLAAPASAQAPGAAVAVTASPVALDRENPSRERVGRLLWRGGLALASDDPRFGGLSGLALAGDAARLIADEGWWLTLALKHDAGGRLTGLGDARMGALVDADGTGLGGDKVRGDAEGLAPLADGGVLVSFERDHRILRYDAWPPAGRPARLAAPGGHAAESNAGLEALTALPGGDLLALSEGLKVERDGRGLWRGFLASGAQAGDWQDVFLPQDDDLAPVAARVGPRARWLYWLERGYSPAKGVRVKLKRAPLEAVRPGAVLAPEELAFLRAPLIVDNLEGLALSQGPDGETRVTLVSDDNFSALQRTLLLHFALAE
jgi:hypothetical protein